MLRTERDLEMDRFDEEPRDGRLLDLFCSLTVVDVVGNYSCHCGRVETASTCEMVQCHNLPPLILLPNGVFCLRSLYLLILSY